MTMTREQRRELVERARKERAGYGNLAGVTYVRMVLSDEDMDALLALAALGAEWEGATEAFVADTDLHHVQDSHGTRRRVLIAGETP